MLSKQQWGTIGQGLSQWIRQPIRAAQLILFALKTLDERVATIELQLGITTAEDATETEESPEEDKKNHPPKTRARKSKEQMQKDLLETASEAGDEEAPAETVEAE